MHWKLYISHCYFSFAPSKNSIPWITTPYTGIRSSRILFSCQFVQLNSFRAIYPHNLIGIWKDSKFLLIKLYGSCDMALLKPSHNCKFCSDNSCFYRSSKKKGLFHKKLCCYFYIFALLVVVRFRINRTKRTRQLMKSIESHTNLKSRNRRSQ